MKSNVKKQKMLIPLATRIPNGILGAGDCWVSSPDQSWVWNHAGLLSDLILDFCQLGILGQDPKFSEPQGFYWQVEISRVIVKMYDEDECDQGCGNAQEPGTWNARELVTMKWCSCPSSLLKWSLALLTGVTGISGRTAGQVHWRSLRAHWSLPETQTNTLASKGLCTSWLGMPFGLQAGFLCKTSMRTLCPCVQPLHFPTEFQCVRESLADLNQLFGNNSSPHLSS